MSIADGIRNWFWRGAAPLLDTASAQGEKFEAELAELKKLLRRQGMQQEALVRDLAVRIEALSAAASGKPEAGRPDSLMELTESFFHLTAALSFAGGGAETREAVSIVWEKLDGVCSEAGLETVRQSGAAFDSRIHEALDRAPDGESPVVRAVASPGFVFEGRVLKPARVALADANATADAPEGEETHGE